MVLNTILSIVLLPLLLVFIIIKYKQSYWKRKGIPQVDPTFFVGSLNFKEPQGEQFKRFYETFKAAGVKHGGAYFLLKPLYVPTNIEVVKSILIKDFHHFMDRGVINVKNCEETDPLAAHLVHLEGEKWKNLRTKLTPTFTSGKMKMMFQTMADCTKGLEEMLHEFSDTKDPVEIKEILARFTTDIIGRCAFGIECNTLKNPNSDFRKYTKLLFEDSLSLLLRFIARQILPRSIITLFGIKMFRRDVEKFFLNMVKDTVEYRERNHIYRKDFMHSMLQLKNIGQLSDEGKITDEHGNKRSLMSLNEISAQCFVFFVAGFETSSTTMNFAFYELAINPDIQERLRTEVNDVLSKHNNEFTYESISEMHYLDRVIKETLRKYPPLSGIVRKCTIPYQLPGTDVILDKGVGVHIPVLGIHMDPEYYPDPEKFDPERFTKENEESRPPCTWLPFGEGPRQCIGLRFGLLQSKVGIASIISKFKVSLNEKTQTPLIMSPKGFITTPIGGVWINVMEI